MSATSALDGLEAKWGEAWERTGIYRFDRSRPAKDTYAIDTPTPTVSGALHLGHVCSYTHTDTVARYRRMTGRNVFYPMGWDDNGLNVERQVQAALSVACDPNLPYDPSLTPSLADGVTPVSRQNFAELCQAFIEGWEERYRVLWTTLGLSVDWSMTYSNIGNRAVHTSQRSFLGLVARGIAYRKEGPTLWDTSLGTAVAQAEAVDRPVKGEAYRVVFRTAGCEPVEVMTTRPEMLPACVAVVVHPEDRRWSHLVGTQLHVPLVGTRIPVHAHPLVRPDEGTGVVMVCTFGDSADVTWWQDLALPLRPIIDKNGLMKASAWGTPGWATDDIHAATALSRATAGLPVRQARRVVAGLLAESGLLAGEPSPIERPVLFWENGTAPVEIVSLPQWFIRLPSTDTLLALGRRLTWHPDHMRTRFENWVQGLKADWNISRQRYFGVPFPIWYPVGEDGEVDYNSPIVAGLDQLPVDPGKTPPPGFGEAQRGRPGGFVAEPDVMDTWATSSLTTAIASGWVDDTDLFAQVFPMDLHPQAHEIIRTWLFYSLVRGYYDHGDLPWSDTTISGFVVAPDRKKLSKSAGNSRQDPMMLLEQHGADAVRYWAACARPGVDTTVDENKFRIGRRLANKILAVTRLVVDRLESPDPNLAEVTEPIDVALLSSLDTTVEVATAAFQAFDYALALNAIERFFWKFCGDYVELVKDRAYGPPTAPQRSAVSTLAIALDRVLRLFAPFLPFATEEAWSSWRPGSVHRSAWPVATRRAVETDTAPLEIAARVLARIHGAKTEAKCSLRTPVRLVIVTGQKEDLTALAAARADVIAAGRVVELRMEPGEALAVEVAL